MLKKFLKYDLKNIFKFLIIFYSLALFFSLLTRIFFSIQNSLIMNIIGQICSGTTISMIFSIIINNLMRMWVRFKQNLYGDEAYLTHTLPLKKETIYLSKILTAIITLFVSVIVSALSLFIAYYSKENINLLKTILLPISTIYDINMISILIIFLFILFLEFGNILQCGFAGIIIGHRKNNAKTGYSVLFGFISFLVSQLFVILLIFLIALFNKDLMNFFVTKELITINAFKTILYLACFIYTLLLIIGYVVNIKLFKKGVNVE
ncbi:MAG: hypothetical protein IJB71_02625 [Bacilli bacterium]|nr:hypothetical protein [Bacilli bacterium]